MNFIEKGYGSKINQKELAENLGISQEYLCYLFNKEIGVTFTKFVKNYRIEAAKKTSFGRLSKEELPYHVGFSDPKYFNKVFRETVGDECYRIYGRKIKGRHMICEKEL